MVSRRQLSAKAGRLFSLALCLFMLTAPSLTAHADSYNVSAVVPYPAPTQAAVFGQPPNNTTVNNALQTVTGTCELLSPEGVVSIWRGGSSIGSSICNGTFSIPIMLQEGTDVLIARSASASGLYGPDSAPLTLILNLPPNIPPPTGGTPNTPQQTTIATNNAVANGLTITLSPPFSILSSSNSVSISFTVSGGTAPYSITVNWGDGSVETRTASTPGVYNFTHTYHINAAYIVHGQVTDALGSSAQFSYAVLGTQKPSSGASLKSHVHLTGRSTWFIALIIAAILLFLITDYWLGWHQSAKHFAAVAKKRRKKALAARKRKKTKRPRSKR